MLPGQIARRLFGSRNVKGANQCGGTATRRHSGRDLRMEALEQRTLLSAAPNDPKFADYQPGDPERWHHDVAQTPAAWEEFRPDSWGGKGVVIALLDSGVDYTHPDLEQKIWINVQEVPPEVVAAFHAPIDVDGDGFISLKDLNEPANENLVVDTNEDEKVVVLELLAERPNGWRNGLNEDGAQHPDWIKIDPDTGEEVLQGTDDLIGWNFQHGNSADPEPWNPEPHPDADLDYHGTNVAGIAAAETNNGLGIAGIAGDALIMPLTVDGDATDYDIALADAYRYAADHGAQIMNQSYSPPSPIDSDYVDAVDYAYMKGVLHVKSAGNNAAVDAVDQEFDQMICVAGTDEADVKRGDSNYGTGIDVCAPAWQINTTHYPGGGYHYMGGTSSAAPVISGVAALIWSKFEADWADADYPTVMRDKVAARLLGTVDNIDDENAFDIDMGGSFELYNLAGMLGTGRVNAARAVDETFVLPPPRIAGIGYVDYEVYGDGQPRDTSEGFPVWEEGGSDGTTNLTVRLANVFMGPKFDVNGTQVKDSPIDDPGNWKLEFLGDSGDFDPSDEGQDVTLQLDFDTTFDADGSVYSNISGYKIGMNELRFSFPDEPNNALEQGRYRFTAVADDPSDPDDHGLQDPFGIPLDGNRDGIGGDDYVRYFYVGDPTQAVTAGDPAAQENQEITLKAPPGQGLLEVYVNPDAQNPGPVAAYILMEVDTITLYGSDNEDTFTLEYLDKDYRRYQPPDPNDPTYNMEELQIIGNGGADELTVYGGPFEDSLTVSADEITLDVKERNRFLAPAIRYQVQTDELFSEVTAFGGGGHDTATIAGTAGDDQFVCELDADGRLDASLTGGGYEFAANSFAEVTVNCEGGGTDTAELFSSPGDELLKAGYSLGADTAQLSNEADGWSSTVAGFDEVTVHSAGGVDTGEIGFEDLDFEFEFDTVYWEKDVDDVWDDTDPIHWFDRHSDEQGAERLDFFPNSPWINVEIRTAKVTADEMRKVHNLTFGTGDVAFTEDGGLTVYGVLSAETEITPDDMAELSIQGGVVELVDSSKFVCRLDNETNDSVTSTGDLGLAGELTLEAVEELGPFGQEESEWGMETRTIMSATGDGLVDQCFINYLDPTLDWVQIIMEGQPVVHPTVHLGHNVYTTDPDGDGLSVNYYDHSVTVDVLQPAPGDTTVDGIVDGADIEQILAANLFGVPDPDPPATWLEGDFTGDGVVGGADIEAILAANKFGAESYVGAGQSPIQGIILPGDSGDGVADLKLRANGLTLDTDGATLNGYVLKSKSAAFTGNAAVNLGTFQEDKDHCISGNMDFALTGTHLLGDVLADPGAIDLLDDLVLTYTLDGQAGIYVATLDAGTLTWDGLGDGAWDSTTQWTGDAVFSSPNNATRVVVQIDTVSVTADAEAASLTVTNGGTLAVDSGHALQIVTGLQLQSTAEYVCRLDAAATGLLAVTGGAALDGTLTLQAEDFLGDLSLGEWGGYTVTIITADGGFSGQFADVRAPHDVGDHLGHGVFATDLFDFDGGHGQVITYDSDAVHVDLFQAAPGDCNGDRQVDGSDTDAITAAGKFGKTEAELRAEGGWPALWTEGDFNGDGLVDGTDIEAMLATNLYGMGIYWPGLGGGGASAPEGMSMPLDDFLASSMFMEETSRISAEDLAALYDLREMIASHNDDANDDALAAIDAVLATGAI